MGDAFDKRRHDLEEEYFRRREKEVIEKMREKMKVAAEAKAAGTSSMTCPRCSSALKEAEFEGVMIDTCEKCGGVWLDSGELGQLIRKEAGWFRRFWSGKG